MPVCRNERTQWISSHLLPMVHTALGVIVTFGTCGEVFSEYTTIVLNTLTFTYVLPLSGGVRLKNIQTLTFAVGYQRACTKTA